MDLKTLGQLFSFRDLRNMALGLLVVFGGLALAGATVWAHRTGNPRLAGIAASVSLVFVLLILIFVVPPLARSAGNEASQMDLPFEFTAGGALFFVLVFVVGFSAWYSGNNLLFLILSFLVSALVVGFLAGNFCLKKLDVKMRFPETVFAGEQTPIIVSLHNRKRLFPTYSIVAEVRGRARESSVLAEEIKKILPARLAEKLARPPVVKHTLDYFLHIPRRAAVENKTEHVFPRRGRFIIKDFELSTRFPFGFFRHRRRLSAQEAEILIFPRIAEIEAEIFNLPFEVGRLTSPHRGGGQDLLALREYQPQDDLRHVDWKASARSARVIVREFSAEDERRVTVVFDSRLRRTAKDKARTLRERIDEEQNEAALSPAAKRFEKGVESAASLLARFADEQSETRLVVNGETGEYGFGKEHLHECLKRLALVEPNADEAAEFPSETIEELFAGQDNSYTFFVTSKKDENLPEEVVQQAKIIKY